MSVVTQGRTSSGNVGVYAGYSPDKVDAFEDWLGKDVDFVLVHAGRASWSDWLGSVKGLIENYKGIDASVAWSLPMFITGGSFKEALTGAYDANYLAAAKLIAASAKNGEPIYIRIGEEFNGAWQPWAAKGQEKLFIATFQRIVDIFRSVDSDFKFEWNVNMGDFGMNPADAYPGNDYVDVIGMDFYYKSQWDNPNTKAAWDYNVSRKYGLQWLEDFAKANNKPTAYSEWGIDSADGAAYMAAAKAWFDSHNVLYQVYWDVNYAGSNQYMLNDTRYTKTAAAYKTLFGDISDTSFIPNTTQSTPIADASTPLAVQIAGNAPIELTQSIYDTWLRPQDKNLLLLGTANSKGIGNASDNIITGNAGNNLLRGEGGADTLYGGAGDDTLDGGAGADKMYGGVGNDVYIVDNSGDLVVEAAGEGIDTIQSFVTLTLPNHVENFVGLGAGALWIKGNGLANAISGNDAANTIYGEGGDDVINGFGGADKIIGGLGNDMLTGGDGADTFIFVRNQTGADVITDFGVGGRDALDLTSFIGARVKYAAADVGANTVITFGTGETITLVGVHVSDLTATSTGYIYG